MLTVFLLPHGGQMTDQDHSTNAQADNLFRLDGKVAIITGGSKGLGAAMAVGLAQMGARTLLVSRSTPQDWVTQSIAETGQPSAHFSADLSEMPSVAKTVEAALSQFGQIDILINNAGIVKRAPFLEHTEADWDLVVNTNLKIPVFLAQACAREMLKRGQGGKIINICSLLSHQGGILIPGYTAAKHGLAGVTKLMSNELAQHGINVNGIAPGYIRTDNTASLQADPVRYNAILTRIPQGRWGEATDMVGAAIFLASAASNYVNGHILDVDGGWMGR
jgi:2-deoxy-D-gluconate 3-dehydrogenase